MYQFYLTAPIMGAVRVINWNKGKAPQVSNRRAFFYDLLEHVPISIQIYPDENNRPRDSCRNWEKNSRTDNETEVVPGTSIVHFVHPHVAIKERDDEAKRPNHAVD